MGRIVKQEHVEYEGKTFFVSTVDLGLDCSLGEEIPRCFETMVFINGDWDDLFCDRYTTWEAAEKGHADVVDKLIAGTLEMYR